MKNGLINNDVDIKEQQELLREELSIEQYMSNEEEKRLFRDILSGIVNPIKNCCCKKKISPDKLSCVDLSVILPRVKKMIAVFLRKII